MFGSDKGKAKALATASTLQKVVCPAPERDPQEILSNGWRKVGEQKRVTNRLANGHPDHGVGVRSREPSFRESSSTSQRQNGREVLAKMFGHMRPHHIMMANAVLKNEEQELEIGLGCQAARQAFFRPFIGPALSELPPNLQRQSADGAGAGVGAGAGAGAVTGVGVVGAAPASPASPAAYRSAPAAASRARGHGSGSESGEAAGTAVVGGDDGDGVRQSPSSPGPYSGVGSSSLGRGLQPLPRRNAGGAAAVAQLRQDGGLRRTASGCGSGGGSGSGSGGGSTPITLVNGRVASPRIDRRGALPAVGRAYPSDCGTGAGAGAAPLFTESTRLPMAMGGGGGGGVPLRCRRASISGDTVLPAIGGGSPGGHGGSGGLSTAATPPPAAAAGGAKAPGGRARRSSLTSGVPDAPGAHPAHMQAGGGGGGGMPNIARISQFGRPATGSSGSVGTSPTRMAVRGGGGSGGGGGTGGGPTPPERSASPKPGAAARAFQATAISNSAPLLKLSFQHGGGGGGSGGGAAAVAAAVAVDDAAAASTLTHGGLVAQLGDPHGGGGMTSPGGTVSPAVPLSGLENLAATGLGDAISQLRHIRMGGPAGGTGAKKSEPGLAGLTPLMLLPVPLPPLDNWQTGGKQGLELDPCRGIRLVDTANYVLPKPTAEASLQVRMAHNQAAMRNLVKAEGAPMSDQEMEAVKLLGRLERSGARHRNFDSMDETEGDGEGDEAG